MSLPVPVGVPLRDGTFDAPAGPRPYFPPGEESVRHVSFTHDSVLRAGVEMAEFVERMRALVGPTRFPSRRPRRS